MVESTIAAHPQLQRLTSLHDIERDVIANRLDVERLAREVSAIGSPAARVEAAASSTEDTAIALAQLAERQSAAFLTACRAVTR